MEFPKPKHEFCLRAWIAIAVFMAVGKTFIIYFVDPNFLPNKLGLYNSKPVELTPLAARLFGCWTLLSSIVRAYCSLHLRNKVLYHVTLLTFIIAFLHFATELLAYDTCLLQIGVIYPLVITGISSLWMFIAQWFIEFDVVSPRPMTHKRKSK